MKYDGIQMLRAVAANAVLLAHLSIIEVKYGHDNAVLPDWVGFGGAAGVNLFFVISGFVMAMVSRSAHWTDFIRARVLRIYPIYWVYTSLVLVVFLMRPDIVNQSFAHPPSILNSYLLWPEDVFPLLAVGWTLIHEMYFYIVMAAIIAFAIPLRHALPAWALIVLATPFVLQTSSPVAAVIFHPMTLEFITGAAIGLVVRDGSLRKGQLYLVAGLALLGLGVVLYGHERLIADDRWARVVFLGAPFVPIVYGVAVIERNGAWPAIAWLSKLGDASYSTYLSHVLIVSALGRLFIVLPIHNLATESMFLVICVAGANAFGLLSYNYIERPLSIIVRSRISRR